MISKNTVLFYKNLVQLPNRNANNLAAAMSVQNLCMHYGYMLDDNAFEQCRRTDMSDLVEFHKDIEELLAYYLGAKGQTFQAFYPDFPERILDYTKAQCWYDQWRHYVHGQLPDAKPEIESEVSNPEFELEEDYFDTKKYIMLRAAPGWQSLLDIYKVIAESTEALTPRDVKILEWFATSRFELPEVNVKFKENLAVLAAHLPEFKVSTVTDVLRIACVFGDVKGGAQLFPLPKLPKKDKTDYHALYAYHSNNTAWVNRAKAKADAKYERSLTKAKTERDLFKFKLSNEHKKRLLDLFETSNLSKQDLVTGAKYGRFIRLFEILKPSPENHPKTAAIVYEIRNQIRGNKQDVVKYTPSNKIRTWQSHLITAEKKNLHAYLELLSSRPSEFVRRLDYVIRKHANTNENTDLIFSYINQMLVNSTSRVLFDVYNHFMKRKTEYVRQVKIKNNIKVVDLPMLKPISEELADLITDTIKSSIRTKVSMLPKLPENEIIWIDPALKMVPLPTDMRMISDGLKQVVSGTRYNLESDNIRLFVHWFDEYGDKDIDLHAIIGSIKSKKSFRVGFSGGSKPGVSYSGDVRRVKGSCAEYIDIDLTNPALATEDFIIMYIHNFTESSFKNMQQCYGGYMTNDYVAKNSVYSKKTQLYDPSLVNTAIKLQADANHAIIGAIDIQNKQYIHLDIIQDSQSGTFENMCATISNKSANLNVYDLLYWHAEMRGIVTENPTYATKQFKYADFVDDYTQIIPYLDLDVQVTKESSE